MESRDNIQNELRGLNSELSSGADKQPFSVPDGYFDGLAASIMGKIKSLEEPADKEIAGLSPLLAGISRSMPFYIPDNYFQNSIEELPFLINEDADSAILSLIDRVTPYQVPAGYFYNLPDQILKKVSQPKAKIIPIVRRRWMRMAVAAMVIGILGLSGIFYFSHNNKDFDATKPIAQQLKNVSTKELTDFIKTADATTASTETAQGKPANKVEVKQLLNDVSDNDLNSFLNQVPTDDL